MVTHSQMTESFAGWSDSKTHSIRFSLFLDCMLVLSVEIQCSVHPFAWLNAIWLDRDLYSNDLALLPVNTFDGSRKLQTMWVIPFTYVCVCRSTYLKVEMRACASVDMHTPFWCYSHHVFSWHTWCINANEQTWYNLKNAPLIGKLWIRQSCKLGKRHLTYSDMIGLQ